MAKAGKSPAKKPAKGKKAATGKKTAAAKKPPARKAAPKKAAAAKKPAAREAAPKKAAAAKKAAAPKKAAGMAGASAPRGNEGTGATAGSGREAPRYGFEKVKPQIAAAADAIESTFTDLVDKADVRNFPDKMWRLLAMVAFAFLGYWVFIAVVILAAMQWVVVLLGDKPSPEIAHYMERCSAYVRQVLDLLSYRSEALPWPLGPLPGEAAGD